MNEGNRTIKSQEQQQVSGAELRLIVTVRGGRKEEKVKKELKGQHFERRTQN